jgi:DNA sulfur modification protein DndD
VFFMQLELEDYRCYFGRQVLFSLDSVPTGRRNIVVMAGNNGSGKSTFFEALGMALFGHEDVFLHLKGLSRKGKHLELRARELNSLLNHEAFALGRRSVRTRLHLLVEDREVVVERRWLYDDTGNFREATLHVIDSGVPVPLADGEAAEEEFQAFLERTIPPKVAQFFFFDGERVRDIARGDLEKGVREGVDTLLGFDLLRRLEEDLDRLQAAYQKENELRHRQENELTRLENLERDTGARLRALAGEMQGVEAAVEEARGALEEHDRELERLLGRGAPSPANVQHELETVTAELLRARQDLETQIDQVLVASLPRLRLGTLQRQLAVEVDYRQRLTSLRQFEPAVERLAASLFGASARQPEPPLSESQARFLAGRLREQWHEALGISAARGDVRHQLLDAEEMAQAAHRSVAAGTTPGELFGLVDQIRRLETDAGRLRRALGAFGGAKEVEDLIAERDRLQRRLGQLESQYGICRRQEAELRREQEQYRQERARKQALAGPAGPGARLALQVRLVRRAVERFQEEYRRRRLTELRQNLTEMYAMLARDGDKVGAIELDEETYHVRLLDAAGKPFPVHELSDGQRQIFALSLLWALARASRRDLPVVIDAPLARLDRDHRAKIVSRYLPAAGRQVFVLSTDTELDRHYLEKIDNHLLLTRLLVHDARVRRTVAEDGYFEDVLESQAGAEGSYAWR